MSPRDRAAAWSWLAARLGKERRRGGRARRRARRRATGPARERRTKKGATPRASPTARARAGERREKAPSSKRAAGPPLRGRARAPSSGADASPSRSTSGARRRPAEQLRARAPGESYPAPRAPGGCGRAIALARWCSSWRRSSRWEFADSMPLRRGGKQGGTGALNALVSCCSLPKHPCAGARFAAAERGSSPRPRREGRHRSAQATGKPRERARDGGGLVERAESSLRRAAAS